MQQLDYQPVSAIKYGSQATQLVSTHHSDSKNPASNDDSYIQSNSGSKQLLSVLGNVIGGAVLLAVMFNLPVLMSVFLGG